MDLKNSKRGQAAIEFLTTYGWAVLVIVIVLIALGWLGLFNVQQQVPDQCKFPLGTITCKDIYVVRQTTGNDKVIRMTIRNDFSKELSIGNIACSAGKVDEDTGWPVGFPTTCVNIASGNNIAPGAEVTLTLPSNLGRCADATGRTNAYGIGSRYSGKLYIAYNFGTPSTGNPACSRVMTGDLVATVQAP